MNNYLLELVKMFADGTPLDALQLQTLLDNNLVRELSSGPANLAGYRAFEFTSIGAQLLKTNT